MKSVTVSGKKRVCILGSTGSVGTQTLAVIAMHRQHFTVHSLVGGDNVELLIEQAKKFRPKVVAIANESKYVVLKQALSPLKIEVCAGDKAICQVARSKVDVVVVAITGVKGLFPVMSAIDAGNTVALANKESLVCAGSLVVEKARRNGVKILPVDSEHSALFQVYGSQQKYSVDKFILTASGGAFLRKTYQEIQGARVEDALQHPNWSMGKKITIDSTTLMNKGLELIEACHLFDVDHTCIDIVIHPQSIVHSMIAYKDGSTLAHLGFPDMRVPIAYALSYPNRIESGVARLDVTKMQNLTFEIPDLTRFPALNMCRDAFESKMGTCAVLNGANEIAVKAFLQKRIAFGDIIKTVGKTLECTQFSAPRSVEDFLYIDRCARLKAQNIIGDL